MPEINEVKKYLDKEGLQVVWSKALGKFVTQNLTSETGKAIVFNEKDGGGAKYEHTDGTWSFAGVNNGGKDGIAAQIYAVDSTNGYKGVKLDVTKGGIYYTTGDNSGLPAGQRDITDNEIVVRKDIKDLAGGMHFIGSATLGSGETIEQAIQRVYTEQGKVYADRRAGDIVIIKTTDSDREFICDSNKNWVELGDQGNYATKAELEAEATARNIADEALDAAKLNLMPGDEHTGGNAYNLPYYFYTNINADKVEVHALTRSLDGKDTYGDYSLDVVGATSSQAGLMTSTDKDKLDNIQTLSQAEIDDICK